MLDNAPLLPANIPPRKQEFPLALTKGFRETQKFRQWLRFYFDPENKTTFLNGTQSALRAYNTESPDSAAVIGNENLRKLKALNVTLSEQFGYSYAALLKMGIQIVEKRGDFDQWEKLMIRLGFFEAPKEDPKKKGDQPAINVLNILQNFKEGKE